MLTEFVRFQVNVKVSCLATISCSFCLFYRLAYFERNYSFYNQSQLMTEITRHYSQQVSQSVFNQSVNQSSVSQCHSSGLINLGLSEVLIDRLSLYQNLNICLGNSLNLIKSVNLSRSIFC